MAGIASSFAQSVYSVNAVGYINVTIQPGYNLVANQLNGTNNAVATVIPSAPDSTRILKWNGAIQDFEAWGFVAGVGWLDEATGEPPTGSLNPGEGFFVQNQTAPPAPFTLTFVGEVPQGTNLTVTIGQNYNLVSSIVPLVPSMVPPNFPAEDQMQVLKWVNAIGDYVTIGYVAGVGWLDASTGEPADPAPAVGEGVFVLKPTAGSVNWVTSFSVN